MTDPAGPDLVPPDLGRLRADLTGAARWYRERLLSDRPPLAVATLADRGLVDLAADTPPGRRWQLGYAPASGGSNEVLEHLRGSGFTDRELVDAGVAVPGRHGAVIGALGTGSSSPSLTVGLTVGEWSGSRPASCRMRIRRSRSG